MKTHKHEKEKNIIFIHTEIILANEVSFLAFLLFFL